jgi:hypothetical protein
LCPAASPGKVVLTSVQAGPTPFISFLFLVPDLSVGIQSVQFTIVPKPGSVARPVSVTYSKSYLQSRGFISEHFPQIMLPVFGLYANYLNTVVLTYSFSNGSTQQQIVLVPTTAFSDPCGFNNPIVIQARTSSREISYDYMLLKNRCGDSSPTILDTDGEIRWVGTAGLADFPSILFQNAIYLGIGATLYRMEFDGAVSVAEDFGNTLSFHHNIDYGKQGMILDENLPGQEEAFNAEVDAQGNVLKTWNLATIISNAMIAGGDDPNQFVNLAIDWFHNNATTYRKSDDSLVISSRENFVICIDYNSGAIKWILGDQTKKWFQFPSLRNYALTLGINSLPPIGEHAVSFTDDDKLLLFDNGANSLNQTPPGASRTYSAPRKYDLDLITRVATEVWNYPNEQSLFSPYCSSIYEDSPNNYLIDYAIINNLGSTFFMELLGLSASGAKVFDYRYLTTGCDEAWNAIPVHLEGMQFTTIVPLSAVSRKMHGDPGTFDLPLSLNGTPGIECRSGDGDGQYQVVVTFPTSVIVANATVTPEPGKTATVSGAPVRRGNQITINLTNVSNAQTIAVNLVDVTDGVTTDTVSVPMSVLIGDSASNGLVNSTDVGKVKLQLGQPVTASNYRDDITADGLINITDLFLVRSLTGTGIETQ